MTRYEVVYYTDRGMAGYVTKQAVNGDSRGAVVATFGETPPNIGTYRPVIVVPVYLH